MIQATPVAWDGKGAIARQGARRAPFFKKANVVATEQRARIAWVDYVRGVGIFLVVLGHTLRGLRSSEIIQGGSAFHFIDSWIYAFHMPLFFWV